MENKKLLGVVDFENILEFIMIRQPQTNPG